MAHLPKVLRNKTKIRFQHCDPFNHLNNARYMDYFMNHREDMLIEHYDIDIYQMAKTMGKSWVSGSTQIAYIKPALLMETVTIESQLFRYNDSELFVEMRMYDEHKTHLKAITWCGFVHFNLLQQKREKHSDKLLQLFSEVKNPLKEASFEERLNTFKPQKAPIL